MNNRVHRRLLKGLEITWAVASKDIVDAIKNRTTLSTVLMVLFLVVFYQFLPRLEAGNTPRQLAVYDAGSPRLMAALRDAQGFQLVELTSEEQVKRYVADRDAVVLGLVLPPGLDQAGGEALQLDGYVVHWADAAAAGQAQSFFEAQLGELLGRPLAIEAHTVHTLPESRGTAFLVSATVVMAVLACGILLVPILMIEEKQTKTMDALLVSPASAGQLVAGKALAGLFYCLAAAVIVLAMNTRLVTHWGLATLVVTCGSLVTVAAGLLLGSLLESRQQMQIWAFVLFIPLLIPVFLAIEPQLVPAAAQRVIAFIPTAALARAMRVSFAAQATPALWGPPLAVLVGWAALLLGAVAAVVRRADR